MSSQSAAASDVAPTITTPTVKFYGLFDVGYVGRKGGNRRVPGEAIKNDVQSGAGSGGSRFGLNVSQALGAGFIAIGEAEFGYNQQGGDDDAMGQAKFYNRHSWVGVTNPAYGTLIAGKIDGARASVVRDFDVFQGAGVGNAGSLQSLATRADDAVAYVTPAFKGLSVLLAYTSNLYGAHDHSAHSPVIVGPVTYVLGGLKITFDHEEESWHRLPGLTRLYVNDTGITYDFGLFKLFGLYDRVTVAAGYDPSKVGFFGDHDGFCGRHISSCLYERPN